MSNNFEKAVRDKLGVYEDQLDRVQMSKITTLQIEGATQQDIDDLVNTPSVINLSLICKGDVHLAPLQELPLLDTLRITDANLEDFAPLEKLTYLRHLDVSDSQIADFSHLSYLLELLSLRLKNCDLDDLSPIESMVNLLGLNLNENNIEMKFPTLTHYLSYMESPGSMLQGTIFRISDH